MTARTPMKRPGTRTAAEIGVAVGRHRTTIVRHIAQPRHEYEANSLSRNKPWETVGVSRATWYRQRSEAPNK